jgi:hypothetical protein
VAVVVVVVMILMVMMVMMVMMMMVVMAVPARSRLDELARQGQGADTGRDHCPEGEADNAATRQAGRWPFGQWRCGIGHCRSPVSKIAFGSAGRRRHPPCRIMSATERVDCRSSGCDQSRSR